MKNQLLCFARLAFAVARRTLPERASKFAPGVYTQPQLLACLLVKEYLRLNYRTAEELLDMSDALQQVLRLRQVPDHSTLWWFARHKLSPDLLRTALEETVRRVRREPARGTQVALDSTGLYLSYCSRHFCRQALGVESLIPARARRSTTVVATTPYRLAMCRLLGEPGHPASRRAYRQRWKVESVMSVAKRKWGEALSARRDALQHLQALLRGVVYNLHRLVVLGAT